MKRSVTVLVALSLAICFWACRKVEAPTYLVTAEQKVVLDMRYGANPKQLMDVYLPANRNTNTEIIILVHGGSFIGGDKGEFTAQAKYLMNKGFAVFNVNYRLVDGSGLFDNPPLHLKSTVKVKDQVDDISEIVDYVLSQTRKLVTSSNIAIVGHSAGGTLALLYAYDLRNTNKVKAVSNIAGALDMVFTGVPNWELSPPFVFEGGYRYTGFEIEVANKKEFEDISPAFRANSGRKVATLNIFPQNNDVMGLPNQGLSTYGAFTAKLDQLKVPNEFDFIANADHYLSAPGYWQLALDKSISYFHEKLK